MRNLQSLFLCILFLACLFNNASSLKSNLRKTSSASLTRTTKNTITGEKMQQNFMASKFLFIY